MLNKIFKIIARFVTLVSEANRLEIHGYTIAAENIKILDI
jgi:hypothetical protein